MHSPIDELLEIVRNVSGIDPERAGRETMTMAIRQAARSLGLEDLREFAVRVSSDPAALDALIDRVVIPETWFFRNPEALEALASWATAFRSRNPLARMRILSVPAATGEEPYSIAMSMKDAGLQTADFEITSADLSCAVLRFAAEGLYTGRSFRGESLIFRDRYFTEEADGYRLNASIRELVHFRRANLLTGDILGDEASYDVIFCRNLLIYFGDNDQTAAFRRLRYALKKDGILFLGPAEPSRAAREGFRDAGFRMAFACVRADDSTVDSARVPPKSRRTSPAVRSISPPVAVRQLQRPEPGSPLKKVKESVKPTPTLAAAIGLADQGRLAEAEEMLARLRSTPDPSADPFFLSGVVAEAFEDTNRAEQFYRKALYLQPNHEDAMLHLAVLLDSGGKFGEARRLRERAGRVLK